MFEEFLAIKTIDYLVYVIFPSLIWNLRILGSCICQLWGAGNNHLSSKLDILITVCLKVNWRDFEWTQNDAILVWSWAHTLILMWVVQPASLLFRAVVVFLIDKMVVVINVLFFETDFSKKSGRPVAVAMMKNFRQFFVKWTCVHSWSSMLNVFFLDLQYFNGKEMVIHDFSWPTWQSH